MSSLPQRLLLQLSQRLPPALASLVGGDIRRELLQSLDCSLLVHGQSLIELNSGREQGLDGAPQPENLASAARALLGDSAADRRLLLLLPAQEFVATTLELPGVSASDLFAAVSLQAETLLPGYEEPLALALDPASADSGDTHTALWLPQARLDALFAAFSAQGLVLTAVCPRVLKLRSDARETRFVDVDSDASTAVAVSDGCIRQWLHVDAADLEQEAFLEQWQQELKTHPTAQTIELNGAGDFLEHFDAAAGGSYCFFPDGALRARRRTDQGRRLAAAAVFVLFLGLLASLPFLTQWFEYGRANARLAETRQRAADARANQTVVVEFENQWGPINDYPQQDLPQAMFALQSALSPDQLTSLEVREGLISIQGSSDDPQAILQRLEQDPLFTEVVFARATNNTRYYIDLRLSPVNFEGYMLRYFPDE